MLNRSLVAALALGLMLAAFPAHATDINLSSTTPQIIGTMSESGQSFSQGFDVYGFSSALRYLTWGATNLPGTINFPPFGSVSFDITNMSIGLFWGGTWIPIGSYSGSDTFAGTLDTYQIYQQHGAGPLHLVVSGDLPTGAGAFGYSFQISAVPVPATILLLGCGLAGLAGFRKRLKKE